MANDELAGRTIVILPGSAGAPRGPARTIAVTAEARVLADAIAGALDRIDLFEVNGGLVLLIDDELAPVSNEIMRKVLRENFVTKQLRIAAGGAVEKAYTPVEASEGVIRQMLTAPPKEGGLLGRLPQVQVTAAPQEVAEPQVLLPDDHPEVVAGRRAAARHAGMGTQQEMEAGRAAAAKFA
jgi:hypothetical protein